MKLIQHLKNHKRRLMSGSKSLLSGRMSSLQESRVRQLSQVRQEMTTPAAFGYRRWFIQDPASLELLPCLISHTGCPRHPLALVSTHLRTPGSPLTSRVFCPVFDFFFLSQTPFFSLRPLLWGTLLFSLLFLLELEGLSFPNLNSLCAEAHVISLFGGALSCLFINWMSHCYLVPVLPKFATSPFRLQPARSRLMHQSWTVLEIFTPSHSSSYLLHSAFKPFLTYSCGTFLHK